MEYQKITNLLGNISDILLMFYTKKWIENYDESGRSYSTNKQIKFKISILISDLCDYNDAYIVVKGSITVTKRNNVAYDRKLAFKNNAPFIICISKIDNKLIANAKDLDIVVPMYNLNHYSKNYSKKSASLWNYYRDKRNSGTEGNINYSIRDSNLLIIRQVLHEN